MVVVDHLPALPSCEKEDADDVQGPIGRRQIETDDVADPVNK